MRSFIIVFAWLMWASGTATAQRGSSCKLQFTAELNSEKLNLGTFYTLQNGDSIQITTFKFYVSNIQLLLNDEIVYQESNSYHLLDDSELSTMLVNLKGSEAIKYNCVKFDVGIDSITNYSGAMGGELDPVKGMYWTWQNGYINFKIEGKSNHVTSHTKEFQFHLGGYQFPFNSLQEIKLKVNNREVVLINVDLDKLISEINLSEHDHIMSPCKEAMMLSEKISNIFSIIEN